MNRQVPTLEDVARVAGVSRSTVSRVVNGVRNVDPDIQAVVREAIARTGYVPNRAARTLVTRRSETIALVVSGAGENEGRENGERDAFVTRVFADPFFGRVVSGVFGFLRPHDVHPLLLFVESEEARAQALDYLRQGGADGALVVSTHPGDPLPTLLADEDLPVVCFARPALNAPVSYVDLAQRDGGRLAAEHLLSLGCRAVVTVAGPLDVPAGWERLAGFREGMERGGLPRAPFVEGSFTQESGEVAMSLLLNEHPDVDGVFAANDLMARGVCETLRESGRTVPGDVVVVGFDDSSAALTCKPPLTTVRQPVEDMAAAMARLLLEHLHGERSRPTSVIFEPELVVRVSA